MKRITRPLLLVALVLLAGKSSTIINAEEVHYRGVSSAVFSATPNPDVAYTAYFCGEKVGLDRLDMYERLDREITALVYGHGNTLLTIKRANRYFPIIYPILKKYGVPTDFAYLACIESYLDVRAYSPANAAGIWQFIAPTARQYGLEVNDDVDERYDPEKATIAAAKYLKDAYAKYGHWPTVAASYNAGTAKISSELSRQLVSNSFDLYLTEETSRYVFRIMAMKMILENPKRYGYHLKRRQLYQPIKCTEVEVKGSVSSWAEWAKKNGITYSILRELNPWIRSTSLANKSNKTYQVKIPISTELYRSKRGFNTYYRSWATD